VLADATLPLMTAARLARWRRKFRDSLARRGTAGTLRLILKTGSALAGDPPYSPWSDAFAEKLFDRRYGVETAGAIQIADLETPGATRAFARSYVGSDPRLFAEMLGRLKIRFEEFTFIDLGCGKGRTLLLASEHPFKRIVGVEFSPELHRVAQHNIERFRPRAKKCPRIEAVCADATAYEFPPGKLLVYMFNPFGEPVMRPVIGNLERCLRQAWRETYIVYLRPTAGSVLEEFPFLHEIDRSDFWRAWYAIYRASRPV
jgi:SAM-dependent methyltransferase